MLDSHVVSIGLSCVLNVIFEKKVIFLTKIIDI